jgi:tRNA(fMet)-specific endonuclease VapC
VSLKPRYLLDTNICIYLMKNQPPRVAERFSACRVGEVLISAITAAELEYGVVASGVDAKRDSAALARFLLEVPVAPFDGKAARVYGAVRWVNRERRREALDKLIAAHALVLTITLVTNNPGDFIPDAGLRIENRED